MKAISRLLLAVAALALLPMLFSCADGKHEIDTYVVVGKRFTEGGMCHSEGKFVFEHIAVPIVPHVHVQPPPHRHTKKEPEYLLLLANGEGSLSLRVEKILFDKINLYNRIRFDQTDNKVLSIDHNKKYVIERGTTTL